jgi:hypothetical protein
MTVALSRNASRCLVTAGCCVALLVVLLVAGTFQSGRAAAAQQRQRQRVLFFGDSLSYQAGPFLKQDFNPSTTTSYLHLFPGTALCDWLGQIDRLKTRTAPDVVVLQFIGNHATHCSTKWSNFVAQYGYDLRWAISQLRKVGVRGIVVDAGPTTPIAPWWPSLVATYKKVIASYHSRDIIYAAAADAGVESPTGGFVTFMPCLPVEVRYGKCVPGSQIKVRASDKVHFCPVPVPSEANKVDPCPVYASGAYRFAQGLAKAVWTLDPATNPNRH